MTVAQNLEIVRRLVDRFVNAGDPEAGDTIFADDCINHPPLPDAPGDRDSIKRFVEELRAAFPDMRYEIVHLFGEGNLVALNLQGTGTHRGAWRGIAPTGRRVHIAAISVFTMREGRIAARHNITDLAGVLRQISL